MCTELHRRLKLARERRGLSLATIARQSGVRESTLDLIEGNRFEDLPSGLYGRNAVRAYATAVGVPVDEALAEVGDRLRTPEDPLDGLARVRGLARQPERTIKDILHVQGRELTLSTTTRAHVANVLDALTLLGIDYLLLELTALVAGVRATEVLRVAAPSMIALFVLIAALYFVLLGGLARATIGSRFAHTSVDPAMVEGVVRMLRLRPTFTATKAFHRGVR
jgi:transcriptional regulator with XRE-family HTH domain